MSDSVVLREYLIALGFKIDAPGQKKFEGGLVNLDKKAMALGKTVLGVAVAAQTMVGIFTAQMEKLYYASRRAQSTAGNLQAVGYGADQIGVGADRMKGAVIGIAAAIRANPGLTGLLNSLGVRVKGRDMSDVALDLVTQLKKMPPYIAQQYAQLFGIDPDTLFMLSEGLDTLKKAAEERRKMALESGVDTDKAAEAAKNYANQLRTLSARVGLLADMFALKMLPGFSAFTAALDENLAALTRWLGKYETLGEVVTSVFDKAKSARGTGPAKNAIEWITTHRTDPVVRPAQGGLPERRSFGDKLAEDVRGLIPDWMRRREHRGDTAHTGALGGKAAPAAAPSAPKGPYETPGALFERLEQQYSLPPGLLYKIWSMESGRGRKMLSPKGAKGHFGFMDDTAAQYGVTDPNDLTQSATGSAKMWAERIKARGGDVRAAAADYNWGLGNVNKYGLGAAPAETRDYMDKVAPVTIQQTNKVTVTGVSDPADAAKRVGEQQRTNNADLVRNITPRVR